MHRQKPTRLKGAKLELIYGFALPQRIHQRVQDVAAAYGVPYQDPMLEVGRSTRRTVTGADRRSGDAAAP
jgi:hypothetical protein